jgi:protein-S-isoprenylcysteine O-methyltransferase Ste14
MKATSFEFRFRFAIGTLIYIAGFWAPWLRYGNAAGAVTTTWLELSGELARITSLQTASIVITVLALVCAVTGTFFRVWGTAYLGTQIVQSHAMHAQEVLAAGPYRRLRNPLYLGSFVFGLGIAILMPLSGAIFFVIASLLQFYRLILREEPYLAAQQGQAYLDYKARVPRLLPSLVAKIPASSVQPHWLLAVAGETFYVATTLCFLVLAWRYNAGLMSQAVLVCFGLSLVMRAMLPRSESISQRPKGVV